MVTVIVTRREMDYQTETLKHPTPAAAGRHRRQVRSLPFVMQLVDVGDLGLEIDPIELMSDLDPGFLPGPEGADTAA
jgi:hypothetical protein